MWRVALGAWAVLGLVLVGLVAAGPRLPDPQPRRRPGPALRRINAASDGELETLVERDNLYWVFLVGFAATKAGL